MSQTYFISGIDTDAGKTFATGYIAARLIQQGKSVITQKFIQTGCDTLSDDIEMHRRIMGTGLLPDDLDGTTAPLIFHYPASAQLAARMDGRDIDLDVIDRSTARLAERYDIVLIEGAGGLMVPITDEITTIDYIATRRLPVILVTNGILGSINHTLLSLSALQSRSIPLAALIYNAHFDTDPIITADTRAYLRRYLTRHHPTAIYHEIPTLPH